MGREASIREIQDWMRQSEEGDLMRLNNKVYRMEKCFNGLWIKPVLADIHDFDNYAEQEASDE